MTGSASDYIKQRREAFLAFRRALSEESDRGCALFAAAYLDKALSDLLYVSLVESKQLDRDLFQQNGPLGTFSARIKFAYYLGKISLAVRRDLDTLRNIRNDFAHHPEPMSFDVQSVSDRCSNLSYSWHRDDAQPRAKFTAAVAGLLAELHAATDRAVAPEEKADTTLTDAQKEDIRARAAIEAQARFAELQRDSGDGA